MLWCGKKQYVKLTLYFLASKLLLNGVKFSLFNGVCCNYFITILLFCRNNGVL